MSIVAVSNRARVRTSGLALYISLVIAVHAAQAAETPLTLSAAVAIGVTSAPLVSARNADITAAREQAAAAGRLPDPSLTFGVANYPVTNPGALGWRSDPMTMRTVGVTQMIPSYASRRAQRELAGAKTDAARADQLVTAQSVQERVADAWIGVWSNERQQALLLELRDEGALAVRVTRARLQGGTGSATDVLAARAALLALDNRLAASAAALAAAQATLARWLGHTPGTLAAPPDFSHLPLNPAELDRAVDRQAPLRLWRARERAAQAEVAAARASKHPDWSVGVSYGNRATGQSDMVTWEIGLSLPLFSREREDRTIGAKTAELRSVRSAYEDARRAETEAVERAGALWLGWGRQIDRDRDRLLPLAHDRTRLALAAYRGGGSLEPWLDARRDEIRERLRYVEALETRAELWASLAYLMPQPEETP